MVGTKILIDYLINFARPFIFTTALSPHSIASIDCSFEFLSTRHELQQQLRDRINHFNDESHKLKLQKLSSNTQIQGIVIPGNERIKKVATALQSKRFDVRPILSPTVASGSERLRICLHTFNSPEEISRLVQQLSKSF